MKSRILLAITVIIAACTSIPAKAPRHVASLAPIQRLTFAKVRDAVIQNNFSSVEQTLAYLVKNFGEYLSFHTLVYDSHSLQTSDYQYPRVIVFGPQAKFILTFNSAAPGQNFLNTDALEMMEFDSKTSSFELNEVSFRNGTHHFSGPNPKVCLQCHSSQREHHWETAKDGHKFDLYMHPNWKTYPLWPGVYGSVDDNPTGGSSRRYAFEGRNTKEASEYAKFMAKDGNRWKGRYRFLPEQSEFLNGSPNFKFTVDLFEHNFRRIAALVGKAAEKLKPYRYSLVVPISSKWEHIRPDGRIVTDPVEFYEEMKDEIVLPLNVNWVSEATTFIKNCTKETEDSLNAVVALEKLPLRGRTERLSPSTLDGGCPQIAFQLTSIFALAKWASLDVNAWAMNPEAQLGGFNFGGDNFYPFGGALLAKLFNKQEQEELRRAFLWDDRDAAAAKLIEERAKAVH